MSDWSVFWICLFTALSINTIASKWYKYLKSKHLDKVYDRRYTSAVNKRDRLFSELANHIKKEAEVKLDKDFLKDMEDAYKASNSVLDFETSNTLYVADGIGKILPKELIPTAHEKAVKDNLLSDILDLPNRMAMSKENGKLIEKKF